MTTLPHARNRAPHPRQPHRRASALAVALLMIASTLAIVAPETVKADSTEIMGATLPTARDQTSAVWTGEHAYVFGGCCASTNQIVRYDPATDTTTTMNATLPTARWARVRCGSENTPTCSEAAAPPTRSCATTPPRTRRPS